MAPVSTYITNKLGSRKSLLVSSAYSAIVLAFTGAYSKIWYVTIFFGVLFGTGVALLTNPHFFLCNDYFPFHHKRHVLATSLMTCGFPLGSLIFNPLTYLFISKFGWNIAFAINAIILISVIAPTSLLMVEVSKYDKIDEENEIIVRKNENKVETKKLMLKTRIIIGSFWLIANTLKSMAYAAPFMFLVIK